MSLHGYSNVIRAFRDRDYRNFQSGSFLGWSAVWMYRTAIGWLVWEMTGSSFWLGVVGFLNLAPAIVIAPVSGVLADRIDRLRYLRIAQSLAFLQILLMGLLVTTDLITLELIVALSLWHGINDAAIQPINQSLLPNLVGRENVTTAFAVNSLSFNLSRFVGPVAAGLAINTLGVGKTVVIGAFCLGVFVVVLFRLKKGGGGEAKDRRIDILGDIRAGLDYAGKHEGIGPLLLVLTVIALLSFPVVQLLPAFADGVYGMGANGLAWLHGVMGIGAMAQGAVLAQRGPIEGLTGYIARTLGLMAAAMILLCVTGYYSVGLVAIFVLGFSTVASRAGIMTLLQHASDPAMRGRLASFYGVITRAGPAFGALLIGALAEPFGLQLVYGLCGALTLGAFFWMGTRKRRIAPFLELTHEDQKHRTAPK